MKKVKERIELKLVSKAFRNNAFEINSGFTFTYEAFSKKYIEMPKTIEVKIKREPKTLNEFLEVNDLNEVEVLEHLIKNYK